MIFTAIGTAIAGALFAGSVLAANIIAGVLAFGTQLALSYLKRPKKRTYSAVQGQKEYGARVPVWGLYGTGKVQGHHIYYAKWGKGNAYNADVFILSNGWCDGLEPEIYFYGQKHALIPRAIIGNEVAHYGVGDFGNLISIRFYDGRPGQGPDTKLVADTANIGQRWKTTSVCAGMAYVVVERQYDEKFDKGIPEFEFILRGLRLYDPRKDSTVAGGAGPQRITDPSTWQFSENPALERLNYQLGLRGQVSGRTLIGEGKSLGQLDLGSYFAAMNACDALRNGKPTYRASLLVTGEDDHTEVLKEFDDAMAGYGMNRRGLSGVIAGAPQIPVMDIGPDDIDAGRAVQIKRRKSAFDLYNNIGGQFISKEANWNPESLKPVTVNADVAADGRMRQTSNDFLQVTDPDIAQYLLQIRYRQNRKGGSATIPVSRRVGFNVEEGNWVTYAGLTWLVTGWQMDSNLEFTLTLAETGSDVYSSAGIEPGPIIIPPTPPVNPSLLTTVQDFTVEVGLVDGPDGYEVPALRFKWTPPDDPTIIAVRFEYFEGDNPTGKTVYTWRSDAPESGEELTSANVAPAARYTARATIVTVPDRFKSWTAWFTTVDYTGDIYYPGLVEQIDQHVTEMLDWLNSDSPIYELGQEVSANTDAIFVERSERMVDVGGLADRWRDLYETVNRTAFSVAQNWIGQKREFVVVREELADVDAGARSYADDVVNLAIGPGSALAERLTTIEASADANYIALSGAIDTVQQVALNAVADEATARQALRIQLVGNYTGNDIEQVTSGLLYQDRQAWISETQSLSNAIDLISAGVGILFDWIDQWSFNTSVEGWTGNGVPTATGGWLRPANHATEPYVVSPDGLAIDGNAYKQIKLRIRKMGAPAWRGQFWWQGAADSTWDAGRRETITEPTYVDGIAVVTVDTSWSGAIDRLRVDLSAAQTASDYFEIDWISVGRPSPGASQAQVSAVQQALASQILAEASNREALSVALTGLADPTGATIPSLTQGLIYDESVARVTGDEANTLLIQGVAAQIDDPSTGLDALAQVQSTMQGQISSLDGTVTVMGQSIDDLLLSVDDLEAGKADIGITDGLQAQINQMGGGEGLSLLAEAMRSMRLTVDRLALGQAGVWLAGRQDRNELGDIVADVHQEATSRIDVTDDQVALHGRILDQINLDLGGKADLILVSALDGRVTATESEIETIGTSLVSINASIGSLQTGKADASAVNGLTTRVTSTEAGLQSLSEALIGVDAKVDGVSAAGKFRVAATATETGALSTIGLSTAATANGATSQAAMLMSARSDGKSKIGFLADMVYFKDPAGRFDLFVIEGNTAYFNRARIRDLDAVNFTADKIDAKLILQNGSVIEDLIDVDTFSRFEPIQYNRLITGGSTGNFTLVGTVIVTKPSDKPCIEFINVEVVTATSGGGSNAWGWVKVRRNGNASDPNSGEAFAEAYAQNSNQTVTVSETKMRGGTLGESTLRYDIWVHYTAFASSGSASVSIKCDSGVWVFR